MISRNESRLVMFSQLCSECGVVLADVQCRNCEDAFCAACSQRLHARGNRTQHVIVSLKDIAAAQSFRVDSPRSFAAQLRDDFGNSPSAHLRISLSLSTDI